MSHKYEKNEEFHSHTKITMFEALCSCREQLKCSSGRVQRMSDEINELIEKNISLKARISHLRSVILNLQTASDYYHRQVMEIIKE